MGEADRNRTETPWLACYTQEEIGEAVGLFRQDVAKAVEAQKMEDLPKSAKENTGPAQGRRNGPLAAGS